VNQRRFLIVGESTITIVSAAFAALVWLHLVGPVSLLVFSFIVTVGSAMTAPAWQTVVAQLVPKSDLPSAVAANSVGINVSRAIGPASLSVRWELPRPSGSTPLATLGSSRLSFGGARQRPATRRCRPNPSGAQYAPGFVTSDTVPISERRWFAPLHSSYSAARTGHSCRWWLARRSRAALRCMVCC
jgi:MFS family permease